MYIRSSAFFIGTTIPFKYTCDGDGISPPLTWESPPHGTKSFVLIVRDSDAPNESFVHWLVYDLPSDMRKLPEGLPNKAKLPHGGTQGKNSAGSLGFSPPCPSEGTHRYFFKIIALDKILDLPSGASIAEVMLAMEGHVLEAAEMMGRYAREIESLA